MVNVYASLHPKTKELLLFAMLHTTGALMKGNQKFLIKALADTMVEALLFGWIKAKYDNPPSRALCCSPPFRETRPEIWEKFFVDFEGMFQHMQVVVQLRIKLLQLTLLIREMIYPLSERKIQKKQKDIRNMAKGGDPRVWINSVALQI